MRFRYPVNISDLIFPNSTMSAPVYTDIILISVPVMIAIIIVCTISVSISFESMIDWKEATDRNAMLYFTFSKSNERANVRRIDEHLQQLQLLSHCAIFFCHRLRLLGCCVNVTVARAVFLHTHTHIHTFFPFYMEAEERKVFDPVIVMFGHRNGVCSLIHPSMS